ncbi:MAG: endolytic transglycosylase MltG, partial [Bacteroidales bacterium]
NIKLDKSKEFLYIPTGSDFEDVCRILKENNFVDDINSFRFVAEKKKYINSVKAGRYELYDGMSNNELVNLLRSGKQTPVNLSFISLRSFELLAGKLALYIEADSAVIAEYLNNPQTAEKYGFNLQTFMAMFIPNTYQVYWTITPEKLIERLYEEYQKFWNDERKRKASKIGFTPVEVSVLASIVEAETQKNEEKARVAGVYINRLNKGMLLQADPTVIFAVGDFSIRRVLNRHLEIDSPYNTYKYPGLPPGPINIPSISSIDAVLNYEKHNYLYFCAKADFSGYHEFAVTLAQHEINAKKYRDALRKAGIR